MLLFIIFTTLCILITYMPYKIFDGLYNFYQNEENDKEHLYENINDLRSFTAFFLSKHTDFKDETINIFTSLVTVFDNLKSIWNNILKIFGSGGRNKTEEICNISANVACSILNFIKTLFNAVLIVAIIFGITYFIIYILSENPDITEYINNFTENLSHLKINIRM